MYYCLYLVPLNTHCRSTTPSSTCLLFSVFYLLWYYPQLWTFQLFLRLIRCVETVAFVAVREKCQHVTRHFTSQMKRDPFLVLPHASSPVCAAWMDIMNGLSLAVCVWPTMVLWDICILQSTVYHLCVVCVIGTVRKIPWKKPCGEIWMLQSLLVRS